MSINVDKVYKDKIYGKEFKKEPRKQSFNADLFEKGKKYFEMGGILENIPEELKNSDSFMDGYRHAERLSKIAEMQQGGKSK